MSSNTDSDIQTSKHLTLKLDKFRIDEKIMIMAAHQIIDALPPSFSGDEEKQDGALSLFSAMKPKTEVEAMLAVQMVVCHNLAMEAARRSVYKAIPCPQLNDFTNQANKLMKTFALQTEALTKLQGKTKTVTIKHVTVAEGGQAILGDVHHGGIHDKK